MDNVQNLSTRLLKIKTIICDIDGTMTDGGIYYDEQGNELKKFNTKDAAGFFCAKIAGLEIVVLTGRESAATARRMRELQVTHVVQNVKDKCEWLKEFMAGNGYEKEQIAYLGDDLNDLQPIALVGYAGCPSDAASEVKNAADYICACKGGDGTVREFVRYILEQRGQWEMAYKKAYRIGI